MTPAPAHSTSQGLLARTPGNVRPRIAVCPISTVPRCVPKTHGSVCPHKPLCTNVFGNTVHDGQKVGTSQTPVSWWMDKQTVVCPYNGILFGHKEERRSDTGYNRENQVNRYTMVLNMFTGVCNHYHNLSLEDFNHPEEKPCTSKKSHSISPSPTSPWQPLICFLSALQNFL